MTKRKTRKRGGARGHKAAPSSAVSLAMPTTWDRGATGPANRIGLVEEDRPIIDPETGEKINPNGIRGMKRETWVHRYFKAGKLTVQQYVAALSLQDAALGLACQDPLKALPIDKRMGGSDPEAARVDARRHFRRLWAAVPQFCRPVVERVVIDDQPVWTGGKAHPRHIERLCAGLDAVRSAADSVRA